jgi:hypothetical protein
MMQQQQGHEDQQLQQRRSPVIDVGSPILGGLVEPRFGSEAGMHQQYPRVSEQVCSLLLWQQPASAATQSKQL